MAKYTFDENGDTFNFFVLTTLAIILIPTTYLNIFKKTGKYMNLVRRTFQLANTQAGHGLLFCIEQGMNTKPSADRPERNRD